MNIEGDLKEGTTKGQTDGRKAGESTQFVLKHLETSKVVTCSKGLEARDNFQVAKPNTGLGVHTNYSITQW